MARPAGQLPARYAQISPAVAERLGCYVYALADPRNGSVFYVGKGKGGRALQHARDALDENVISDKLDRIRCINEATDGMGPEVFIVRYGLTTETAKEIEASLIDALRWFSPTLANAVRGHGSDYGIRTLRSYLEDWQATPMQLSRPSVIVNIRRLWRAGMTEDELWEAGRKWWPLRPDRRRPRPELLIAIADNIVRGAWPIDLDRSGLSTPSDQDPDAEVRLRTFGHHADKELWRFARLTDPDPELVSECQQQVGHTIEGLPRSFGIGARYWPRV